MVELTRPFQYGGWPHCIRLANREVELIATADVGPRIIRYAAQGGENLLYEERSELGITGGDRFHGFGGHRLWHAPEHPERTYVPDNDPVAVEWRAPRLALTAHVEAKTGLEKRIELELAEKESTVELTHRLTNRGLWTIEVAAWALTQLPTGGVALFPQEAYAPFPERLTPVRPLVLWSYTKMDDPRLRFGARWVRIRADARAEEPTKLGALVREGLAAYLRNGTLFVKRFPHREGANYPDFGCNFESFTNRSMIELESLSPLVHLEPGASIEHVERWSLVRNAADLEALDDRALDRELFARIASKRAA